MSFSTGSDRVDLESARWDRRATTRFLDLLRDGSVRSWRFLEAAGVLERALPEVADAVRTRRSDPFLLDPTNLHRFELVDALRDAVTTDPHAATVFERLRYPEMPMLAALVLSLTRDGGDPTDLASRLSDRLRLGARRRGGADGARGKRVAPAGCRGRDSTGLTRNPSSRWPRTSERPSGRGALYLVSLAMGDLEVPERDRLDELLARVLGALNQPDLTGRRAGSVVESRRAAALRLAPTTAVADRIRKAPRTYLLANTPEIVVRQAALLDPSPGRGVLRFYTEAIDEHQGRIDISSHDQANLMATATAAFAARGIDVVDASAVTWPDGAVVESYVVRSTMPFRAAIGATGDLNAEVTRALREPRTAEGMADLEIDYDNVGSPWYTLCEIRGRDRPGVLHTIAVGFANSGVTVHSARIETISGVAIDHFELSDAHGLKLSDDAQRVARDAIWSGSASIARRGRLGRRRARGCSRHAARGTGSLADAADRQRPAVTSADCSGFNTSSTCTSSRGCRARRRRSDRCSSGSSSAARLAPSTSSPTLSFAASPCRCCSCGPRTTGSSRPAAGKPSVDKIPTARFVTMPGGHFPWYDDPDQCAALVAEGL